VWNIHQSRYIIILKKFKMNHAKPYPHDYRRPKDAEDLLKKLTRDE
jgi:transposase